MRAGAELRKHNRKTVTVYVKTWPSFYCVLQGFYNSSQCVLCFQKCRTIRKSVQAVDEKQDISLLWPNILCVELVEMPPSKIL